MKIGQKLYIDKDIDEVDDDVALMRIGNRRGILEMIKENAKEFPETLEDSAEFYEVEVKRIVKADLKVNIK